MVKFDDDVKIKLDAPSKRAVYDLLTRDKLPKKIKRVLLLGLGHWLYASWLMAEHPEIEEIVMMENAQLRFLLRDLEALDLYNILYVEDNKYLEKLKEMKMKFDCIIMNPPYQRNLHLKILAEAIKHLKDDGTCVNLSPISIYQKCVKLEKEFPITVTNIDVVSQEDMNNCFGIGLWVDGGIVTVDKNASKDFSKFTYIVKHLALYKKLQKHSAKLKEHFTDSPADFPLRFFVGCNCDMSHKFTMTPKTYADACVKKLNSHIAFINCISDNERHNLYDVACGRFMKFCCYIDLDIRPWLGDAINPRTGKKGYTGEWTDDDLYKFFNITPEEQKLIEDTMKKYEAK